MAIGPSTPWQLTVIQWGWRCSHTDHVLSWWWLASSTERAGSHDEPRDFCLKHSFVSHFVRWLRRLTVQFIFHSPVLFFHSLVLFLHSLVLFLHSPVFFFTVQVYFFTVQFYLSTVQFYFSHSPVLFFSQSSFNFNLINRSLLTDTYASSHLTAILEWLEWFSKRTGTSFQNGKARG